MKKSLGVSIMELSDSGPRAKGCTVIFSDEGATIKKIVDQDGEVLYEGGGGGD
jgi:hypothetical protein